MDIALVAAGVIAAYLISLWWAPSRACGRCKGEGTHSDRLWQGSFGRCWKCKGSGRSIRLGVRVLKPGTAKAIRNGEHRRNF